MPVAGVTWRHRVALIALVALIGIASSSAAWAQELPRAAPEEVGLASARLDRIRRVVAQNVEEGRVAGAVLLVARHGKVAWFEAVGMRDREAGDPMRRDAIFRVYSMTKPVTSVAVLTLLERGRLRLSDPVSQYLPEFAALQVVERARGRALVSEPLRTAAVRREMTVQDLLRQTSGLTSASFGAGPVEDLYRQAAIFDPAGTLADAVRRLGKLPLKYEPGTAWEYGVSHDVAARLVEVVSGMRYDEYLARRVFGPLGMKDTGFFVASKHHDRLAQLYDTEPERAHALVPVDSKRSRGVLTRPPLLRGASGLVSTAEDFARFGQMLLDGGVLEGRRVLGRKTVELMTSDHRGDIGIAEDANLASRALADSTRGYGYGLGVGVRTSRGVSTWPGSIGDFYWDGAASTLFWVDPEEDLVAVFMIQLMDYFRGGDLQEQFRALVYAAIEE